MTTERGKRSSRPGLGDSGVIASTRPQRVGGRQAGSPPAGGGGGYLGTYTGSNFAGAAPVTRDPRVDELRVMGLPAVWIRIAETIGFDPFLAAWRILDAEASVRSNKTEMIQPLLRPFRSYLRFQRNRYIEALAGRGLQPREIQEAIKRDLCERVSIRHVSRIARGA